MTDAPENSTALPAVRVGDADREIVARRLQIALDEGRLDLMELDRRLIAVYSAQTTNELVAVTADLPASTAVEPLELRTGSGAREKRGHWVVPAEITAECSSGSIRIDFTQAVCPHPEVALHVSVRSGSVQLTVPHGWRVDLDRVRIKHGSLQNKVDGPVFPGSPLIRVDGEVGSGAIKASYPKPPKQSFWAWMLRRPRPAA